jgi:hypothetical protein
MNILSTENALQVDFLKRWNIILGPYSGFPVIKNKKSEECIEIINLKLPPRHLHPSRRY